jgi:hypothetical protein
MKRKDLMVSIVDLAKLRKKVELRGEEFEVRGLSVSYITSMLGNSNELRMLLAEKALTGDLITTMIADLPNMVAECIAEAMGHGGDADSIAFILLELSPGEWVECLEPIFELTFPRGVKSFMEALFRAGRSVGLEGSGWAADTSSAAASPASSQEATLPRPLGNTPRANSEPGTNSTAEKATEKASA